MNTSREIIPKLRRQLALSALLQNGLMTIGIIAVILSVFELGPQNLAMGMLLGVGVSWMMLTYNSVRSAREAADIPLMIAAGEFGEAENRLAELLKKFNLFRNVRLQGLHQLVLLRHAQRRSEETVELARALLAQRLGKLGALSNSTHLILAESLLKIGDIRGTYQEIALLYDRRLALPEAIGLLRVQLDYLARIEAWEPMLYGLRERIALCELMPSADAAGCQALLALAAKRISRHDLSEWLKARALLLVDAEQLTADRPILTELLS